MEEADEEIGVQRGAGRLRAEAGARWLGDRGGVPEGRDQQGETLRLAQEVSWADAIRDAPTGTAER